MKWAVILTLLDVSEKVNLDKDGSELLDDIKSGRILSLTARAESIGADSIVNIDVDDEDREHSRFVHRQVAKFLQTKDKYTALASILLKSWTFYLHRRLKKCRRQRLLSGEKDGPLKQQRPLPVVDLPRTQRNKPFIPIPHFDELCQSLRNQYSPNGGTSVVVEENVYPLSISHQFPFVGMATTTTTTRLTADMEDGTFAPGEDLGPTGLLPPLLVGLDIVVFEDYNRRLYATVDEFLDIFRDSLTSREWNQIQAAHSGGGMAMQELYVTWAMKEAYTKALGVGMELDFSRFEVVLEDDTDDCSFSQTITNWGMIQQHLQQQQQRQLRNDEAGSNYIRFGGKIQMMDEGSQPEPNEFWDFFFVPLGGMTDQLNAKTGCACVCVGPIPNSGSQQTMTSKTRGLSLSWTTLESLIDFHSGSCFVT